MGRLAQCCAGPMVVVGPESEDKRECLASGQDVWAGWVRHGGPQGLFMVHCSVRGGPSQSSFRGHCAAGSSPGLSPLFLNSSTSPQLAASGAPSCTPYSLSDF